MPAARLQVTAVVRPVDLRLRMRLHNALEARRSAHSDCDVFQRLSEVEMVMEMDRIGERVTGFSTRGRTRGSWVNDSGLPL